MKRSDVDTSLKDFEGYTAFDLYNSTLSSTKPPSAYDDDIPAELYTWGANRRVLLNILSHAQWYSCRIHRNAALGVGDGDDRTYPDQVIIQSQEDPARLATRPLDVRLSSIQVLQVSMSRLHTGEILRL